jgi:hypothetical protein
MAKVNSCVKQQEADQQATAAISQFNQAVTTIGETGQNSTENAQNALNAGVAAYNSCMALSTSDPNLVNTAQQVYSSLQTLASESSVGSSIPSTAPTTGQPPLTVDFSNNSSVKCPAPGDSQSLADGIKSISDSLSSSSQLNMVQLQQDMSDMQQIISLISQILSKLDETTMTVINNTGK